MYSLFVKSLANFFFLQRSANLPPMPFSNDLQMSTTGISYVSFYSKRYFLFTFGVGSVLNLAASVMMGIVIMLDAIVRIVFFLPNI